MFNTRQPIDRQLCFVLMPFKMEFSAVYDAVRQAVESECRMSCVRADDISSDGIVIQEVWDKICAAQCLVADLTGRSPNVFYELGLAHALDKRVVILAQNGEDIPFDLRHRRVILYERSDLPTLTRRVATAVGQMTWKAPQILFWASTNHRDIKVGLETLLPGASFAQSPVEARGRVVGIPTGGLSHSIQAFVRTNKVYEQGSGLIDAEGFWRIDQVHLGSRTNRVSFRINDEAGRAIARTDEIVVSKIVRV